MFLELLRKEQVLSIQDEQEQFIPMPWVYLKRFG